MGLQVWRATFAGSHQLQSSNKEAALSGVVLRLLLASKTSFLDSRTWNLHTILEICTSWSSLGADFFPEVLVQDSALTGLHVTLEFRELPPKSGTHLYLKASLGSATYA